MLSADSVNFRGLKFPARTLKWYEKKLAVARVPEAKVIFIDQTGAGSPFTKENLFP